MKLSIELPDEVGAALQGEASRRLAPLRTVVEEFFAACWPDYQAKRLREAFAGLGRDLKEQP